MTQFLNITDEGAVRTISLNRPEKRNALHSGLVTELYQALLQAGNEKKLRVLILTGVGDVFCAGADLSYLEEISKNPLLRNREDSHRLMDMMLAVRKHPLPVIARLNGHAIAGGCGLAMACDIVVAVENAKLGFPEVRIGFIPAIVARLLIDRIGSGRAHELLLRGNLLTAAEAHDWGMVNHVVQTELLDDTVYGIAEELSKKTSAQAVAMTKQLLRNVSSRCLEEAMRLGAELNAISRETPDFAKGILSFLDKQPPSWE